MNRRPRVALTLALWFAGVALQLGGRRACKAVCDAIARRLVRAAR